MSSLNKVPASSNNSTEESGWTMYFDDFFNNHVDVGNNHNKCSMSLSSVGVSSSSSFLVSDAASLVEKKMDNNSKQVEEFSVSKRSSFKKRSNKDIISALIDDALEDTATSPLNSPKEKGHTSGQKDEQKELNFNAKDSDECTELKKRGLFLVHPSMVANHLC